VQIPFSFAAAILLQANLPILIGLQFLSNAFTLPPIYAADYYLGHLILNAFRSPQPIMPAVEDLSAEIEIVMDSPESDTVWAWIWDTANSCFELLVEKGAYFFGAAMIGGLVLGMALGIFLHLLYRILIHPTSLDLPKKMPK
jgi:uncharacterized protein (DUF2062 family)